LRAPGATYQRRQSAAQIGDRVLECHPPVVGSTMQHLLGTLLRRPNSQQYRQKPGPVHLAPADHGRGQDSADDRHARAEREIITELSMRPHQALACDRI